MRSRFLVLFFLLTLALGAQYKPWYNYFNPYFGTKALAMGNAFTAMADDATAVFWNPAGLARLANPEFYLSYRIDTHRLNENQVMTISSGRTNEYTFSFNSKLNQIDFFSITLPAKFWRRQWGFALGYYRYIPYGFSGSAQTTVTGPGTMDKNLLHEFSGSEGIDVLAFSLAVDVSRFFQVGVTIQQFFNSGTLHNQFPGQAYTVHRQYNEWIGGWNTIWGVLLRPVKPVVLGAAYHTPLSCTFASSSLYWQTDSSGLEYDQFEESCQAQVYIPAHLALGLVVQPVAFLKVALEYSLVQWSKGKIRNYYDYSPELPYPIKADFDLTQRDVWNKRIGVEVGIPLRRGKGQLQMRGGYFDERQLYPDSFLDDIHVKGYSLGAGVRFSEIFSMELAYQKQRAKWFEAGYFQREVKIVSYYDADIINLTLRYHFQNFFRRSRL